MGVINQHRIFGVKPSDLFDIKDPYTAYCFNEAVALIIIKMNDGEEPQFKKKYGSFSDIYKRFEE